MLKRVGSYPVIPATGQQVKSISIMVDEIAGYAACSLRHAEEGKVSRK